MKQLTKFTAKLPDTTKRFLEQVKVFANVLSALFTKACPLFIHIKEIIKPLMEYKPMAHDLISKKQGASIAWILTLQTKHFFRGEQDTLAEFIMMKNNIRARSPLIYHIEVPATLYKEDTKPNKTGTKRTIEEQQGSTTCKETESPTNHMIFLLNISRKEFGVSILKSDSEKCANFATYQLQVYTMIPKLASLGCLIAAGMDKNATKSIAKKQHTSSTYLTKQSKTQNKLHTLHQVRVAKKIH